MTATRQLEALSKVPISIAAFSAETMQELGAEQVDDQVRVTPALTLERIARGSNTILTRGINSDAGAGTIGVYLDDKPIQVRNLGFGSGTTFPKIFDRECVEVLRGRPSMADNFIATAMRLSDDLFVHPDLKRRSGSSMPLSSGHFATASSKRLANRHVI